ncbi:MAG: hypothetical protein LC799_08935 [Actinobacteria bacterium]|nr:hypothetical protein [Actinomycetota bacterium]
MFDRGAAFDPADLGLLDAEPVAEQALGDAAGAVDGVVVGVGAVSAGEAAEVLGGEGFAELVGLPELGWHLRRGEELVAGQAHTTGALASPVVCGEVCAASAIAVSARP